MPPGHGRDTRLQGPALAAPLSDPSEVGPLVDAGATELYCGVLPRTWKRDFSTVIAFNRRYMDFASLNGLDELRKVIRDAHDRDVKVYLALNAHVYVAGEHERVLDWLGDALACDLDSVIISDLGLILAAREAYPDARICASTGLSTFNSESVVFLKELGLSRIILERQLTTDEITNIRQKVPDIEMEAFVLNGRCRNVEGYCTFQHGHEDVLHPIHPILGRMLIRVLYHPHALALGARLPRKTIETGPVERAIAHVYNPCRYTYSVTGKGPVAGSASDRVRSILGRKVQANCGACALYDLWQAGVDSFKVVGRVFPTARKVADTRFVADLIKYLIEDEPDRDTFFTRVKKDYRRRFGMSCDIDSCYYPEVDWCKGVGR
ncbi:MAG: U32 family peptidase [Candidatus Undinarchaeales archaeon]|nr:U32 family peptidase [Candidatus Undinarchaeales archaeon]MDP7493635.1 U32 family peptidase [Candidatus Undinarchaeales archaeon]